MIVAVDTRCKLSFCNCMCVLQNTAQKLDSVFNPFTSVTMHRVRLSFTSLVRSARVKDVAKEDAYKEATWYNHQNEQVLR